MLDTLSPTCSVWQGWMPLEGAFNLKSGSLAYAFTQTVCVGKDIKRVGEKRAVDGARTRDPGLGKPMLYQLSYYRKIYAFF